MKVPFAFSDRATAESRIALDTAYRRVVDSHWFILGPEVEAFESEFAAYCGAQHCVGVGNGLEAIQLLLSCSGIGPGSEVIVASNTYIATWLGVSHAGARPVPVDPDPETLNICPHQVAKAITPRTKAIFGTHLYGRAGPCAEIDDLAHARGLLVFWDAAHAHGATFGGTPICQFGRGSAFSFYPTKNLGCLGDGGAVVTNDAALAADVRCRRNYGSRRRYDNECMGMNSRLDELQAAFLRAKLPGLDACNERRAAAAEHYSRRLRGLPGIKVPDLVRGHVWHQYVIRHNQRDKLREHLAARAIQTDIHYPTPPHAQRVYADLGCRTSDLPIAEAIHREVLSLPMHPYLLADEISWVCDAVHAFVVHDQ